MVALIDEVLAAMTRADAVHRMCVKEALDRLQTVIQSIAPELLLVAPTTARD